MPETVSSLSSYKPEEKAVEISLSLTGDAAEAMRSLMSELKAKTPNEVVLRAIGFLIEARDHEILLRDVADGKVTAIEI